MKTSVKNTVICLLFGLFFVGMFLCCLFLPKEEFSYSERRPLAQMGSVNRDSVMSGSAMTSFENYSIDNFPFRDAFRTLKALTSTYLFRRQDNNNIYLAHGYAAAVEYPLNEESLDYAVGRFAYIYENFLKDANARVYLSVIPDKGAFLAKESGHLSMDYALFEKLMQEKTKDFASYVTISDLLEIGDYYKTDTHWRQERIEDVAQHLASTMGKILPTEHIVRKLDRPFKGVYYGQLALPLPGEPLYFLTDSTLESCLVYNGEMNNRRMPMYNEELAAGYDPYELFLSGSLSLVTIENPNARGNGHLVLFRDSFGSSVAPLLAEGYEKVTLVDIRYLQPQILDRFVEFEGADVLFLYSTLVLNHSETIK